ncbi:hypothetical protein V6N11_079180 [Hibiscus sabdariffa]|uniref:Uncharacterized protein n=1 Tax=Hibiscus sabdariffa TaxID=183260 RepID=A0ABR2RUZ1_9ROSI
MRKPLDRISGEINKPKLRGDICLKKPSRILSMSQYDNNNVESEKGNAKKESSKKEINESGEHGGMRCQFPGSGNQGEIKPLFQQQFNVASSQLHNLRAKSEKIKEVNCVLKGKQSVNYDTAYSQDVANFVRVSVSVDHNNDMETDQVNEDSELAHSDGSK